MTLNISPTMKQKISSSPALIVLVMLLTLCYLSYLALTSQLIIFHDSIGYQNLAEMFIKSPWQEYFITGPNREPLYSFLISLSMRLAHWQNWNYLSLQVIVQIVILLISQYLTCRLLKKLQISDGICAVILAYMGASPALVSSGLILFSEIITYPLILWCVLAVSKSWLQLKTSTCRQAVLTALNFSIPAVLIIFTKGAFELIIPFMLLPFVWLLCNALKNKKKLVAQNSLIFMAAAAFLVYLPVTAYKLTNKHFNGIYALTDRGPEALYGNTSRRMQPLSFERVQTALAYMAGPDVCSRLYTQRCLHWAYQTSDKLGADKSHTLIDRGLSKRQINRTLITESIPFVLRNPVQYILLSFIEANKILFWESPEIAFVAYSDTIDKIYNNSWFRYSLRCIMAFLSAFVFIIGLLTVWANKNKVLNFSELSDEKYIYLFFICILIVMFSVIHSIFFILPRYALPIVPLFLALIAWQLNIFSKNKKRQ